MSPCGRDLHFSHGLIEMKTYFVYMHNRTSRKDDEVFKVRAIDSDDAKVKAFQAQDWPGRFSVGWALTHRSANEQDRNFLRQFRSWATDKRGSR